MLTPSRSSSSDSAVHASPPVTAVRAVSSTGGGVGLVGALMALAVPIPLTPAAAAAASARSFASVAEPADDPDLPTPFINVNGLFETYGLPDQGHLELRLPGERIVTVQRDYQNRWQVTLPSHPPTLLDDLAALVLGDLTLLLVREGSWLAACALGPP